MLYTDLCLLSFDPGSRHMGIAVQAVDMECRCSRVIHAETLNTDSLVGDGDRFVRHDIVYRTVERLCYTFSPVGVAIELPYMGSRPQAFGSLKETVLTMHNAVRAWRPNLVVGFYEPSVIKKINGVPGNSGDKELMRQALKTNPAIVIDPAWVDRLDEHAVDAILIGYTHVKHYFLT